MHQVRVEARAHADRLGEHGGAARGDAVQRFVPIVEDAHAEARNRRRAVLHLQHFLLQRHPRDQVRRALLGRQIRIHVGRVCRRLSKQRNAERQESESEGNGFQI